jgi:adenylate cyclase class 2
MPIEVEQKFAVRDRPALVSRLAALHPSATRTEVQVDTYFAHPSRDFAHTDEALRLRCVDQCNYITYKGPKLDATTKTRREIEIALPPGKSAAAKAGELLTALGFTRVGVVSKRRDHMSVLWQDQEIVIALDTVESLGEFVELEIVSIENEVAVARDRLLSLADHLQLSNAQRRSYLELLLEQSGQQA